MTATKRAGEVAGLSARWHPLSGTVLMSLFALMHLHVAGPAGAVMGRGTVPEHDLAFLHVLQLWTAAYVAWTAVLVWWDRRASGATLLRSEQVAMAGGAVLMAYAMG